MQLIPKKDHGLTARKGLDHSQMSRKEKRAWEFLSAGRRVEECRALYNELKRWAVAHNDEAVAYNLVTKFYPSRIQCAKLKASSSANCTMKPARTYEPRIMRM